MSPSPARAEAHDTESWLPLPDLDELPALDGRIMAGSPTIEARSSSSDASAPPSPARARPHDPATWFPLPVPDELPSIDDMLTQAPWEARLSPARAEPHDATTWLPLPDMAGLPEAARVNAFPLAPPAPPPSAPAAAPPPATEAAPAARTAGEHRRRGLVTLARPRRVAIAVLLIATAVGIGLGLQQLADRGTSVEVRVDGRRVSLESDAATVRQLLRSERVRLGEFDRVVPSPASALRDGLTVTVLRAFPITRDLDGEISIVYTTYASPSDYIRHDLASETVDIRNGPRRLQTGSTIILRTPHQGSLVVDGTDVPYDIPALNVRELLAQYSVDLGLEDYVTDRSGRAVEDRTPLVDGEQYSVIRVGRETVFETEVIPVPAERRPDPNLPVGETRAGDPGAPGVLSITYAITRRNGEEFDRRVLSRVPTTLARPAITYFGTKADPMWDRIAECETAGNWGMRGPTYSGGLGFYNGTWDAFGGREFASNAGLATREEQIQVAENVRARVGISGWGCAHMLGYVR